MKQRQYHAMAKQEQFRGTYLKEGGRVGFTRVKEENVTGSRDNKCKAAGERDRTKLP